MNNLMGHINNELKKQESTNTKNKQNDDEESKHYESMRVPSSMFKSPS